MTQYKGDFPFPVLFPPGSPKNVLAEVLSNEKIKQYHCAGTNHVNENDMCVAELLF